MSNKKGGLIKKKENSAIIRPSVTVNKPQNEEFGFNSPSQKIVEKKDSIKRIAATPPVKKSVQSLVPIDRLSVSTTSKTKSVKIPEIIHTELGLLGSFIDESKTYVILQTLIDSFVEHELTERQQRQFKFMLEAFQEEI